MTEESRTDFSSNQSRKPFFSPAYATKRCIAIFRQSPFSKQFLSARALVSLKKTHHPTLIQTFPQILTVHNSPKSNRLDNEIHPIHPRQSARSGERSDPSIGSGRVARSSTPASTVSERRRTHRVASRRPSSHHPYRTAHPRRNVTDRARSIDGRPPILLSLSRFPRAHRASHPSLASRKRTLPAGFLAETFLVPPRWVFAAATMTRVVLTASICSRGSCSRGSFVRSREVTPSLFLGSARLGFTRPERAGASFGDVSRDDVRDYWEMMIHVVV